MTIQKLECGINLMKNIYENISELASLANECIEHMKKNQDMNITPKAQKHVFMNVNAAICKT